jgi:Rrf2 family protein
MKLSAKASYAIRALTELARPSKKDWVRSKDLAKKISVSPDFLAQIILALKKKGLVKSQRGVRGGIRLAKNPDKINLRQIIEAVEGKIALKECFEDESSCAFYANCPFIQALKEGQNRMLSVYEGKTLADLVRDKDV